MEGWVRVLWQLPIRLHGRQAGFIQRNNIPGIEAHKEITNTRTTCAGCLLCETADVFTGDFNDATSGYEQQAQQLAGKMSAVSARAFFGPVKVWALQGKLFLGPNSEGYGLSHVVVACSREPLQCVIRRWLLNAWYWSQRLVGEHSDKTLHPLPSASPYTVMIFFQEDEQRSLSAETV